MEFKKILLIDIGESKLDTATWREIDSLAEQRVNLPKDSPDIKTHLADTDCLLVNFGIKIDKGNVDSAPNLKYIGILATAYGKVDIDHAKSKGIPVCNLAGYSTESVAEFVIAAILEHIRELEAGKIRGREGNYSESGISAIELKGKVFGILGLGSIGSRAAELALGFDADVRYWSRNRKKDFEKRGIKYQDADTLIPECDFLSVNLAQTKDTENFLNRNRIQSIKKEAVVVNTAPMELVDIKTLEMRLADGDMTFILDHSDEMAPEDVKRLSEHKNCIVYPPIAYVSKEARIRKQKLFVENIQNFLKGSPTNKVN